MGEEVEDFFRFTWTSDLLGDTILRLSTRRERAHHTYIVVDVLQNSSHKTYLILGHDVFTNV